MESVARPQGAGNSAPSSPHTRARRPGRFVQITYEQLAIPEPPRGSVPDGEHLTRLEKLVLYGLLKWCYQDQRSGKERACPATDLEIADAIGLSGDSAAKKRKIQIALNGRKIRGVKIPGMADPSRGWVTIMPADNESHRLIRINPKFREWAPVRLHRDSASAELAGEAKPTAAAAVGNIADPSAVALDRDQVDKAASPKLAELPAADALEPSPDGPVGQGPAVESSGGARPSGVALAAFPPPSESAGPPAAELSPAPPSPAPLDRPAAEVLAEVLGREYLEEPPETQARILVHRLSRCDWRFELQPNGMVKTLPGPGAKPFTESEQSALRSLKPQIVAMLAAEARAADRPRPEISAAGDTGQKPAPRVKDCAEIRRMIGRLTVGPADDDSACEALARRMVDNPGFAWNDQDRDRSYETFLGLARDVKRGDLPEAIFISAFDAAARGTKVNNRGSYFVAEVKRLKSKRLGAK